MSDNLLVQLSASDSSAWHKTFYAYRSHFIAWAIRDYGITDSEAKDAYQETILVFYEMIRKGKIKTLTGDLTTLLFDIGKKHIIDHLRERTRFNLYCSTLTQDNLQEDDFSQSVESLSEQRKSALNSYFDSLSKRDRDFILMCFDKNVSMDDIAQKFGLKNANVAYQKKFKLIEKLTNLSNEAMKKFNT